MVKRPLHNRYGRPKDKAPGTQQRDSTICEALCQGNQHSEADHDGPLPLRRFLGADVPAGQYGEARVPRNAVCLPRNRLCSGLVNRIWRIVATGFCFVVFGIGGIVMALIVPILLLIPHIKYRETLARAIIHHWFKAYVGLMKVLGLLIVEVRGAQKLQRQSLLILANHPSLIDVVILISLVKNCVCIVKKALWANPFTWAPVYLAGFIRNTGGPKLIDEAIRSIHAGNNLILFPEGTRTRPDQPIFFKRGAANIVLRGNIQRITPVVIKCSEPTLTKGKAWYQIPRQTLHLQLEVLDDLTFPAGLGQLCPNPIEDQTEPAIQVRNLTQYLQHYFSERIQKHGSSQ